MCRPGVNGATPLQNPLAPPRRNRNKDDAIPLPPVCCIDRVELLGTAHALNPKEMFADTAMEARARDIGRGLRCMVCQNQSIFDSNAGLAEDLRILVRERMTAGDTDAQILAYIQDRYGDYVLLEPPVAGRTLVLWGLRSAFCYSVAWWRLCICADAPHRLQKNPWQGNSRLRNAKRSANY